MPELPEVERATRLLNHIGAGKQIVKVETTEDALMYSGVTHTEFAEALTGRKMVRAHRYGKVFYIELDGAGKYPVMHFGMTGMLHVKGQLPLHYREAPSNDATVPEWPPRWMKFILHFIDPDNGQTTEIAFRDARRLGRIRLCIYPRSEPPISGLGFDPIHSMPTFTQFADLVDQRRGATIKALLLDQSFSAGVGNWVADEVLYHARIHPEQRCNALSQCQKQALHEKIVYVCETATAVNADDSQFPEDWLFRHRWGKGSKRKNQTVLTLPSGQPATIKWITVGGRTTAYVSELQVLPGSSTAATAKVQSSGDIGDEPPRPFPNEIIRTPKRRRKNDQIVDAGEVEMPSVASRKSVRRLRNRK
ncbi:AtMMH-1 [Macrolepiota fuliginosa MF-IS2]|uniref:AtMMH-1 n=1 Tax=Macrolepiota fuliginosa MF-IS2 TaxID=1400762 RepID=A0A9P6C7M7_9AGAR|nr:AtMMH-1 [Macrolepiota fuliginosa MF-IS2]